MQTLKDVFDVLKGIPEEDLIRLKFGTGEGSEETISLVCDTDDDGNFADVFEKYPKLDEIDKLVKNVVKAQDILDRQDDESEKISDKLMEEGITTTFFDEDKKSSHIKKSLQGGDANSSQP